MYAVQYDMSPLEDASMACSDGRVFYLMDQFLNHMDANIFDLDPDTVPQVAD